MVRSHILGLSLSLTLSILCALPALAAPGRTAEAKGYFCRLLTLAPELDGNVASDPAWQDLPADREYKSLQTGLAPTRQTTFRMGYTTEALFIGMVCEEPHPDEIHAYLADGEDFRDEDAIHLSLSPDGDTLLTFAVNAIGSRESSRTLKRWQAAVHVGEDAWSAEIALPWEVLGAFPAEGRIWKLNIIRSIAAQGAEEYSTWANLQYHPEEVENFGELRFEAIGPDQRREVEARIQERAIREELLVYSRPNSGIRLQSGFSEDQVVHNQGAHVAPRISPDLNRILFNSMEGGEMGVWIANRGSTRKKRLCDGHQAAWSPDGSKMVFQRAGRLVERVLATGEERVVSPNDAPPLAFPSYVPEGDSSSVETGLRLICSDEDGRHVYLVAPDTDMPLETLAEGEILSAPRCSSDGKTLAFQNGAHIHLMDLATREVRQLSVEPGVQSCPVWAADGLSLCYARAPSPVAEVWDICHVKIADPRSVNLIVRRVHPNFDWSGSSPKPARTANVVGTHLTVKQSVGTVSIENDWLTLGVSSKGAFLVPKLQEGASAEPISLRVIDESGRVADEVADINIVRDSGDDVAVRASFVAEGDLALTSTIRVSRTRPLIDVVIEDGSAGVGLQAKMAFAVVPDRFSNDLVLDSSSVGRGATAVLPENPIVIGCLANSDAMVMLAASSGAPSFAVTNSEDDGHLTALTAANGTGGVAIAVLARGRMWQQATLEKGPRRDGWRGKWNKPFHAEWRMAVRGKDEAYSRMWNVKDLGAWGGEHLPVESKFTGTPEAAIVYAWGRDVMTPATVLVPTDVLTDVWGIGGYLATLDIEGIQGYRVADEWTPFRQLTLHQRGWHPALAHEERGGEFGVLEAMGSVFPVDTGGVRSFVEHLGHDAVNILSGLDNRIGEYEWFLGELADFCDAQQDEDWQGFLEAVGAQAGELVESGRSARRTEIADVDKAVRKVMSIIGTRDRLKLSVFKAFASLPGNDEWAETFEEFESFLAAQEGRIWYNDTVRYELWYDDNFSAFSRLCLRFQAERQQILSGYRTWTKRTRDRAAQLIITEPEFKAVGEELRRKTHAVLRDRYYLEGDWRGETPLQTGALK